MISNKLKSDNCLFMICPTDNIESVLRKTDSKAFFYSALGANFRWDTDTQESLITLIENQKITQVIFITKYTNLFYREVLEPEIEPFFNVNETLLQMDKTLPDCLLNQSDPILRVMLFASRHLQRQQKRILKTSILGKALKQRTITTQSFIYHPNNQIFYPPKMIEKKVLLYGQLSPN
ncbi:hypothetical protein D1818_10015 [Aquimarina sp. BL5]|uniref:hypothetical protein n=1 Tax=Aquimarina sp. BL5 TaxID=1714860 RepID=UPI000E476D68|nr:hypothetical protein [Aquimarina sp. BL5]AXT51144.1 hypothetical protein D1818_10015 [Aquimarina sp. BL5]RKM94744.1 hypothetical protein D7036_21640 [Aquimarina sp. BL5]